jgi:hypothetical protein
MIIQLMDDIEQPSTEIVSRSEPENLFDSVAKQEQLWQSSTALCLGICRQALEDVQKGEFNVVQDIKAVHDVYKFILCTSDDFDVRETQRQRNSIADVLVSKDAAKRPVNNFSTSEGQLCIVFKQGDLLSARDVLPGLEPGQRLESQLEIRNQDSSNVIGPNTRSQACGKMSDCVPSH